MTDLNGRTAMMTGGSRGIGAAIASAYDDALTALHNISSTEGIAWACLAALGLFFYGSQVVMTACPE